MKLKLDVPRFLSNELSYKLLIMRLFNECERKYYALQRMQYLKDIM
jgi:hypothetical protein